MVSKDIIQALEKSLAKKGYASLLVCGGSSPLKIFEELNQIELDWKNITISLIDDRIVSSAHPDSNELLVEKYLLKGFASDAKFISLNNNYNLLIEDVKEFDVAIIGMGPDGHFASLFPDSPELDEGLTSSAGAISVSTPSSDYSRISATLNTITESDLIVLLIFGEAKRKIAESPDGYPIQKLLAQTRTPVQIFWAP